MWNPTRRLRSHSTCRVTMPTSSRGSSSRSRTRVSAFPGYGCACWKSYAGTCPRTAFRFRARQVVERLSGTFVPPGETLPDRGSSDRRVPPVTGIPPWSAPDLSPVPLRHARLFELPRNPETGSEPVVLVLAARELLSEEGVLVERSATNADYSPVGLLSAPWAQYGTLAEAYPASTLAVDDTQGLLYRPYKEDPAFGPSAGRICSGRGAWRSSETN